MQTTVGQVLVNDALPEELRDYNRILTSQEADNVLGEVARGRPQEYKGISKKMMELGRNASYTEGATLSLSDMTLPVEERAETIKHVRAQTKAIMSSDLSKDEKQQALVGVYDQARKFLVDATYERGVAKDNPFALQVLSRARGNPNQLAAIQTTPGNYTDADDNVIPVFIERSYAEGLRPHEYWAGTYGARKSVIATKFATRDAGYLGKQFNQASMRMIVSEDDCEAGGGVPVDANDDDNLGAVLARKTGKFPAGTVIDKSILTNIKQGKHDEIVVRSPLTCNAKQGVCKMCVGHREDGKFAKIGAHVGITSASALAERIAQGSLNCLEKHTEVLMADFSTKQIQFIVPGDKVMGANTMGDMFPTAVTDVWDQGMQPTQRRYYKMGQTKRLLHLDSTAKHPILSNRKTYGLVNGKNNHVREKLIAGYKHKNIGAVLPSKLTVDTGVSGELALMLGTLLGDGIRWVDAPEYSSPRLSCADDTQVCDLRKVLGPIGLDLSKCTRSYDYAIVSTSDDLTKHRGDDGRVVAGIRSPIKQKIVEWGLAGKYAHNKSIPDIVWTWDTESVAKLIAGFIATDGSVFKNASGHVGVSFSSCSHNLLVGLQALLERKLCVYTSGITKIGIGGTGNRVHDQWQFTVTRKDQVTKLSAYVSEFIPGVKRDKLSKYVEEADYLDRCTDDFYRAARVQTDDLGYKHCMDITVAHKDSLFVLANGLIVSNTKHSGGMAGDASEEDEAAGFPVIEQLFQVPKTFPNRASLSELDGTVESIDEAPQGGWNIMVDGESHYALPETKPRVKVGDKIEAGDQLSTGIVNPRDIVRHKGIGEGRRYFARRMTKAFRDSGYAVNRRNMEILTRSVIDHTKVTDADGAGDYLPDEVVSYNAMAHSYKPRADAAMLDAKQAVGQYLEQPILHYSIGTRVTGNIANQLGRFGHTKVMAHKQKPGFEPNMLSLREVPQHEKDWMAQLGSSYLKGNLLKNVHRGATSEIHSTHPVPSLAKGTEFGQPLKGQVGF